MNGLEKALQTLHGYGSRHSAIDTGIQLFVTLGFIVAVVSVPTVDPARLIWFFAFPVIMAEALRIGYAHVFCRSLWLLPFIILIGIFNPIIDRQPAWEIGNIVISKGWISFISVVLRGLLSVQALLILVDSCGFNNICRVLHGVGVPSVLVTQLQMLYRFMAVLMEEALIMHRARQSRGFGRKSYPLKMWATFAGQLLMRSLDRASRINRAMLARVYDSKRIHKAKRPKLTRNDWIYLAAWTTIILFIRFIDISAIIDKWLSTHLT